MKGIVVRIQESEVRSFNSFFEGYRPFQFLIGAMKVIGTVTPLTVTHRHTDGVSGTG